MVAGKVVTSGSILKVNLTRLADGLDAKCGRKVSGLNSGMDGGAVTAGRGVCSAGVGEGTLAQFWTY